jgi:hypothetical protein
MPVSRFAVGAAAGALSSLAVVTPGIATVQRPQPQPRHVIVVGVADLLWSDVSAAHTPVLAALARTGSVGALFSKGNRRGRPERLDRLDRLDRRSRRGCSPAAR